MTRWAIAAILLLAFTTSRSIGQPAPSTGPKNPAAVAAKQSFDQLQKQWVDLTIRLRQKHKESGLRRTTEQGPLDLEIQKLQEESETMVGEIVAAGLDVYRADPKSYPTVNSTLVAIAGFYVTGDSRGDGGDQYEKALPIIKALLEAGADKESPELWLWAGVSAFSLNQYDLAKEYLQAAQQAGVLGDQPPVRDRNHPRARLWSLAKSYIYGLTKYPQWWEEEQELRQAEAAADDLPRVRMHTTRGDIVIELFENEAPQAVANFLTLVKQGFYDGIVFHRVMPAFMAQGGDPTGAGGGGPGYTIRCECYGPGYRNHFRGSLSMAHAGRDTGGSQFFLSFTPIPREDPRIRLNGKHTVFGRVIEGMDIAASIKRRDPQDPNAPAPDKINKAHVLRDRGHEYKFEKLPGR